MKPLKIHILSDGKAGHFKQSRAVSRCLSRKTPALEFEWKIGPLGFRPFAVGKLLKAIKRTGGDVILATGSRTHLAALAVSAATGAKAIVCMKPALPLLPLFDLAVVPTHDTCPRARNVIRTCGPPVLVPDAPERPPRKGLILIGGTGPAHIWNEQQVARAVEVVLHRTPEIEWTISPSRRTPDSTCAKLQALASGSVGARFVSLDSLPEGWLENQYATSRFVWVTGDSISMIYEALSAGCAVGVLPVEYTPAGKKHRSNIGFLKKQGWIMLLEEWLNGGLLTPMKRPLNEADRVAEEILARWWPDRLQ